MRKIYTFIFLFVLLNVSAQNTTQDVHSWLSKQKAQNRAEELSLLKPSSSNFREDNIKKAVSSYQLLDLDRNALRVFEKNPKDRLELDIPLEGGKAVRLHLAKAKILSDDFVLETPTQKYPSSLMGLHYRGTIDGQSGTFASISFIGGEMMGMISTPKGNYVLGALEDASKRYIVYNDRKMKVSPAGSCGTPDVNLPNAESLDLSSRRAPGDVCKIVKLYWEADKDLHDNKGSVAATASYIAGVFNQMATLYQNDGILVELSGTLVWDTADPYREDSSTNALLDFRGRWNGLGNGFNGDLAHLVSLDNRGNGGLAYLNVLCNKPFSFAYSEIGSTYSSVPTYSWTVSVLAHETGHNLGSPHTHACSWNGNSTPIDDCGSQFFMNNGFDDDGNGAIDDLSDAQEANGCFDNVSNIIPSSGGTIMSYCHLLSVGIDFNQGFGPQPKALIQNAITNSSCLDNSISLSMVKTDICPGGTGAIDLTVSGSGTPGYTYSWMPGGTTSEDLSGISSTGNYAVTVTDANSCTSEASVDIVPLSAPGDGDNVTQCSTADFDVLLATSGMSVGSDEVVGWWVTGSIPIAATVTDQATLDVNLPETGGGVVTGASPNLVFESTSGSSLNLGVTYSNLIEGQNYHATPFVSSKQDAIAAKSCNQTYGGFPVGVSTSTGFLIPNTSITCTPEGRPSPADFTIDINVTSYVGAANQLTILFYQTDCSTLVASDFGNAGAGTYTFTQDDFPVGTDPTNGFCVLLYDQTLSPSASIVASAALNVTYPEVPAVTFPTVTYTDCVFGTPIPFTVRNSCVVPVELSRFTAVKNNEVVDLSWQTLSERNSDYFEIQRSTNGIDFIPIGEVASAGNASRVINYSFTDESPELGANFYRLMQVDKDRSIEFSEIREVSFNKRGLVSIYPVPVRGDVFILKYDAYKQKEIQVKVFDLRGQIVVNKMIDVTRGINEVQINVNHLSEGMYMLQAIDGRWIQTKQFIKS